MKEKKQKLRLLLFVVMSGFFCHAQQSINATGGNASGSGGAISYSIGQVAYTTNTGSTGSMAQGVQQPYEISTVLGNEHYTINLLMTVYPNPTVSTLNLEIKEYSLENLQYQLFDLHGRLVSHDNVTTTSTIITMDQFEAAVYLLKVLENNKEIKTFKIIKAQ